MNELYKIMQSVVDNWIDSLGFILVAFFYGLSFLQLPLSDLFHMLGILAVLSVGMNIILSSSKCLPLPVKPH
ncbi:MAG: hypothetical protein BWK73_44070 [Thiothrix lacustris]|uniref:Uncharacterized protein n=1 Tax=Thiothrix lacustris TaxID=525917 RepID=A0A1Y1QBI9_9GAMM|nr:MAG: hypothetical protein BWK73_44070 [Thiothrix lacustris]